MMALAGLFWLQLGCGGSSACDPPSYRQPCAEWDCAEDALECHPDDEVCYPSCLSDADCARWASRDEEFRCDDGECMGPFCSGYPQYL